MVKCPRGTQEQINANLANSHCLKPETICEADDVCKSESEDVDCEPEDGYLSIDELDVSRADKRSPPTTEDEITYLFVNHFLDILLKCWDGTPCRKPKLTKPVEVPHSETGEISEQENDEFNFTEEYLRDLYKTKSQKITDDNKQERASREETLSAMCRERCESRRSVRTDEPEIDDDEEGFVPSWKVTVPDEDVFMSFQNRAWYNGRVSRRLMDGNGTFFWEDGASFQGEFISGTATGTGRLEFTDLSVYEGGVYKGFRHGEGLHCMHDSPIMYSGQWWLGKKYGHGLIFYSDPNHGLNFYNGSWVNGVKEGFGCRQYKSGSKYLGHWKNGKRHGTGIMFWCNNDIYRGEWNNGLMDGFGEYVWNGFVNKTFSCARANTYRGYWANGKKNGVGLLELSNGSVIETIWSDDEKNGAGLVICPNGVMVMSSQLFTSDKPSVLHESEETLLGKQFRSHGFQASRKKNAKKETVTMPEQSQLLAYMSSMEKANAISIPVHTPVHSLDLSCHVRRLKDMRNEILQKKTEQIGFFDWSDTPRMESFHEKKITESKDLNQSEEEFSSEEKLLRNSSARPYLWSCVILVKLMSNDTGYPTEHDSAVGKFQICYEECSTIACSTKPPFECTLLRLFFWELLTLSDVPMKNLSLIDIDNLLASEVSFLIDSPHDPFQKIQLWQFIHFLITLSWHTYGRYIYVENTCSGREEVNEYLKEFYNQNENSVLSSAFNYFLRNHIFADRRRTGGNAVKNWDLLPMGAMYLAYKSIGEPHSAKEFLIDMCRKKDEPKWMTTSAPYFGNVANPMETGKNMIAVANEVSYLTSEEAFNQPEITGLSNDGNGSFNKEQACFDNLTAKDIVRCLIQACPNIMEDGLIVDMEYQLTFLEYYKAMIACASISLKKKALKQIQSEILSNYKKDLEEYDRQMKEYERQKESTTSLTKKLSQIKKTKK